MNVHALSAQQEAILRLAYRNHRRYGSQLFTHAEWTRTNTCIGTYLRPLTLYTWEVMARVYGVRIAECSHAYARRLNWMYWAGKKRKHDSHYDWYVRRGLIHTYRHHLSQAHTVYDSAAKQRVASASMSRAVRAMEKRGLLIADHFVIHLTPLGAEIAK